MTTRAVSENWLTESCRGLTATLERLRVDRQLEEALTCGADPLHLAALFGIDDTTAIKYATIARQLLATATTPPAPANPRTRTAHRTRRPLSSRCGPFSPAELWAKPEPLTEPVVCLPAQRALHGSRCHLLLSGSSGPMRDQASADSLCTHPPPVMAKSRLLNSSWVRKRWPKNTWL